MDAPSVHLSNFDYNFPSCIGTGLNSNQNFKVLVKCFSHQEYEKFLTFDITLPFTFTIYASKNYPAMLDNGHILNTMLKMQRAWAGIHEHWWA